LVARYHLEHRYSRSIWLIPVVLIAAKAYDDAHKQLVVAEQSYMLTTSVLGPGEQELEELRSQSLKLAQTTRYWKFNVLPIIVNALPDSQTTPATNRQEIVEHMWTHSNNSPQALPVKQKKH
jgi:hypothetical protein